MLLLLDGFVVIVGRVNVESYVRIIVYDISVVGLEKEVRKIVW